MTSSRGYFWRYALLAMPLAFAGVPIYIHAPDYYLRNGELSLAVVGLSLFLIRFLDAVLDPAIGWAADKKPEWRIPSLIVGCFTLVVGFALLFSPWGVDSLLWLCLTLILVTAGYSVISIQMNTLGAIWSAKSRFQIRITSLRESFGIVGLIMAAAAPGVLQIWLTENHTYLVLTLILAGMVIFAAPLFMEWYRFAEPGLSLSMKRRGRADGSGNVGATYFAIYALSVLASSIPAVLVIFFIRDRLGLESYTGLFLAVYFLSGILGMPLWRLLARRFGHLRAWQLSMVLACISFVWAFWLSPGSTGQYLAICLLSGVALGGELCLPPALLSSLIHKQDAQLKASRYFALCSFLTKASLALAAGATLPLLQQVNFVPGGENGTAALQGLAALYALLPTLLKICALALSVFLFRSEASRYEISQNARRIHRGKLYVV